MISRLVFFGTVAAAAAFLDFGVTDIYNFVRIHQTLRCTPAMAAGVSATLWEVADMVKVLEEWEATKDAQIHAQRSLLR